MSDPTHLPQNRPTAMLLTALALIGMTFATVSTITLRGSLDDRSTPVVVSLVGMVITVVPGLLAAAYAERASRDLRNGMIVHKAKQGAAQAIDEAGVVTRQGPDAMGLSMETLAQMLIDRDSSPGRHAALSPTVDEAVGRVVDK